MNLYQAIHSRAGARPAEAGWFQGPDSSLVAFRPLSVGQALQVGPDHEYVQGMSDSSAQDCVRPAKGPPLKEDVIDETTHKELDLVRRGVSLGHQAWRPSVVSASIGPAVRSLTKKERDRTRQAWLQQHCQRAVGRGTTPPQFPNPPACRDGPAAQGPGSLLWWTGSTQCASRACVELCTRSRRAQCHHQSLNL